jgi:hypothetical protein
MLSLRSYQAFPVPTCLARQGRACHDLATVNPTAALFPRKSRRIPARHHIPGS